MPEPLLRVAGLSKTFGATTAVGGVSFTLERGRTLGLVGGSGSGKSTLARCIARYERPDSGEAAIDGRVDYTRADVQLIFQEAAASLLNLRAGALPLDPKGNPSHACRLARMPVVCREPHADTEA